MGVDILWFVDWCRAYGGQFRTVKLEDGSKVYVCFYPHRAALVKISVTRRGVEVCGEPPSNPKCIVLPLGVGAIFAGKATGYMAHNMQWVEVRGVEIVLWDTFMQKVYVGPKAELPWPRLAEVVS